MSIGDADVIQFEEFDGTNTQVVNVDIEAATERIVHLFGSRMKTAFIRTTTGDIQVTISPRGKVQQVRHAASRKVSTTQHDRQKRHLIAESAPFLRHVGISTDNGTVRRTLETNSGRFNSSSGFSTTLSPITITPLHCGSLTLMRIWCAHIGSSPPSDGFRSERSYHWDRPQR